MKWGHIGFCSHLKVMMTVDNLILEEYTKQLWKQGRGSLGLSFTALSLGLWEYHL